MFLPKWMLGESSYHFGRVFILSMFAAKSLSGWESIGLLRWADVSCWIKFRLSRRDPTEELLREAVAMKKTKIQFTGDTHFFMRCMILHDSSIH